MPHGAILFDRASVPQADSMLLDPRAWGEGANALEGRGGRGSVWNIRGPFGDAVLRHYRRGGVPGRFVRDRYLFMGEEATRGFREFRLLVRLRDLGLPVPQPLAAGFVRSGLFYRADLLTARVPDARTLAECGREALSAKVWRELGALLARFHRQGVFHADLNAHNIMIGESGALWLLDFDRGEIREPSKGWQQANLDRLHRSLEKLRVTGRESGWPVLREAYEAAMRAAP
jgi:3-deoxy-D-manno-octulosonic acid kinase